MKTMYLALIWSLVFALLILGFYYVEPKLPTGKSPKMPEECLANYPQNVTFEGQKIYRYFWSDECCSQTWMPNSDGFNVCWEKGGRRS